MVEGPHTGGPGGLVPQEVGAGLGEEKTGGFVAGRGEEGRVSLHPRSALRSFVCPFVVHFLAIFLSSRCRWGGGSVD